MFKNILICIAFGACINLPLFASMDEYSVITSLANITNANNYITMTKKGVLYNFVPFDKTTDTWIKNVFPHWEPETFDVFDLVKDSQGIAIDIGSWIGATTIWLSKYFLHVIAVDADKVSVVCLENNLKASGCSNFTICNNAISDKNIDVIFGPAGGQKLNDSMSLIKDQVYSPDDYIIKAITLENLLNATIYNNEQLKSKKISFIKCDIEGGEENIIQELLSFAYQNKINIYLSFHLDWWKAKDITRFENLFKNFKNNCPNANIYEYLKKDPFGSVLFEPLS